MRNKFCELNDLTNEADVETFFVLPLLRDLGYENKNIKPKRSLEELSVSKLGSRRAEKYRPDFGIKVGSDLRMVVEAKGPGEDLDDHYLQPRDYCVTLNGAHSDKNPVRFYLLTNGHLTRIYRPDVNEPILELTFKQFAKGSAKYKKLCSLVDRDHIALDEEEEAETEYLELRKAPLKDINEAFAWCHQFIYKTDNISQGAAFMEFVKIIALKLLSDKRIREKHPELIGSPKFQVPLADVSFSKVLLLQQQRHTPNPLSTIWFADFIKTMELEIATKKKKRIFNQTDEIKLSPETIGGVVERLEPLFLFGIDADLNGRLFETFLSATMRGKDLGQYFTPRSVVKLGVGLARLRIDPTDFDSTDRVYDGCCGTGGFLIDVLADMWAKVNANRALSEGQKEALRQKIANEHIFGADIGRDPNLARIARLNMYLHGDGGSSIFNVDGLDKELPTLRTDSPEMAGEKDQLRKISSMPNGFFDVVITNPPFAKTYSAVRKKGNTEESTASRILKRYDLRTFEGGKEKLELRSNLMFMERYRDLIKSGGRLVTVLDDGILSAKDYVWFRNWLRSEFLINAVVSLPGDAFQRSMARVKTSILVLTRRTSEDDQQPDVFMYPCEAVGIDDPARARTLPIDAQNREHAKEEIQKVLKEYEKFLKGKGSDAYLVSADRVADRLDVKHCLMSTGENVAKWEAAGFEIKKLKDVLEPKVFGAGDVIDCATHEEEEIALLVRYDGSAEAGGTLLPADTKHNKLYRVSAGNIVISNIAASYGSIAVVPPELDGCVVSTEYTVLNPVEGFDATTIWAILRSPVVLSEVLLVATGANRTRVKWEAMQELYIPYPSKAKEKTFAALLSRETEAEIAARKRKQAGIEGMIDKLGLKTETATTILSAFKPPK